MLWLVGLIFFILCVGCGFKYGDDHQYARTDEESNNGGCFIGLMMFILGIACFIGGCTISCSQSTYEKETSRISIVSLQDNISVHGEGNFCYISVNAEGNYTYYYRLEDGGYKQKNISAKNTVIYEEDNCENPEIVTFSTYTKYGDLNDNSAEFLIGFKPDIISTRYEIHVPKGTVVQQSVLDAN